jgi:hypothetical protein
MTTSLPYPLDVPLDDPSMSPRVFLSRRLAKERVDCPSCGLNLTVATLSWSHKCKKVSSEATFQTKLVDMKERAVRNFQLRSVAERPEESNGNP